MNIDEIKLTAEIANDIISHHKNIAELLSSYPGPLGIALAFTTSKAFELELNKKQFKLTELKLKSQAET